MAYVDGMPLDRYMRSHQLSAPDKLSLMADVADALHYAHQQGVAHRDLKPGNIVVAQVKGRPVCHLVDFDTAVVRDATLISVMGEAIGSIGFADPVHRFGRTRRGAGQAALDIYSPGALLYWIFTGKTPPAGGPGLAQRIMETALLRLGSAPVHIGRGSACWLAMRHNPRWRVGIKRRPRLPRISANSLRGP